MEMTASVLVTPQDGRFTACILGSPEVNAVGETKPAAIDALKAELARRQSAGELVTIDMTPVAVTDLVGRGPVGYRKSWREIAAEAYRLRDEEKAREFPE
jgi:hypothetical protein